MDLLSFYYNGCHRYIGLLGEESMKLRPIEARIQILKSRLEHINLVKSEFELSRSNPKNENLRTKILGQLKHDKYIHLKEIKTLSVILSELNTEKIKSMENEMRPPVRLEKLNQFIDGEEQFEAFIHDHVVERGSFEQCQRTLRMNGEFVTRGSIYSKNKGDSSEVIR